MSNILTIAFSVEGSTDQRFLENIIQRTFEEIAFECDGDIDVYPLVYVSSRETHTFIEKIESLAFEAFDIGIQVLCIHTDADAENNHNAMRNKIIPAFRNIESKQENICKNLVAIIPVRMSEAWMLADKDLFKDEIGTTKSDSDLGIARPPEVIADPKTVIEEALRIAQQDHPPKIKKIRIGALYQPLGQKISLVELKKIKSYMEFRQSVIEALKKLNYLS